MATVFQGYADRGVFRGFSVRSTGARQEFRFVWLSPRPIDAVYEPRTRTLTFRSLLVDVPARSALLHDLKRFITSQAAGDVPAHRALDPRRVEVRCTSRLGRVSIAVRARRRADHEYLVRRGVNLIHEIVQWLNESHAEYACQHLNGSQD